MTDRSHTPLPWVVQTHLEGEDGIGIVGLPMGGLVAWAALWPTELDKRDPTRARANAELIVHSVNSLPALVKALEDMISTANELRENSLLCAIKHHGFNPEEHPMPGWLRNSMTVIENANAALSSYRGTGK